MEPINVFEFEERARRRMESSAWDYYASGAADELTLRRNRDAFDELELHYRVLAEVGERSPATTLLGRPLSMPVLVAPTAFHGLADPDGERATARGAAAAGTTMVLSTLSNEPVEEVARAAGDLWFQLYVYRDRGATRALVQRVEEAGCRALVLTVDAPLLGRRERDVRNRFHLPEGLGAANLAPHGYGDLPQPPRGSGLAAYVASLLEPGLGWGDLEELVSWTRLPVWVKGIVRPDDAVRAAEHGARGVVVSNHGGRQLDTAPATVSVLPEIAEEVERAGAALDLLLDGGVRRGTDVVKALALGARAVLVGRPVLWGLAADGERGVARVLELLREELDLAMALAGARRVDEITRDLVR